MIYEKVLSEHQRVKEQIDSLELQLQNYPEGRIFITRNGKRYKWYRSNGSNPIYIPKKERQLAEQLAIKKYISYQITDLKQELTALDFYLRHHKSNSNRAEKMLTKMPEYQELLSPYFKPISQELIDWMNAPYEHNENFQEQLIQRVSNGKCVRSKSEALIDMALCVNKIPFRYESALRLGDSVIYPDFTIRHPKTGRTYYWEHFGRMDDPAYSKNVFLKLQSYTTYGIVPGIHLITTYETQKNPLSVEMIENIVGFYFS